MSNAIKGIQSAGGSGCSHIIVTDVNSELGRGDQKQKLCWTNSVLHNRPTTCVLELINPATPKTRKEFSQVVISVTPWAAKSFPRTCTIATSAHAAFGFRHLALWELEPPSSVQQSITLPISDIDKFLSLSFLGCSDLTMVHRIARLSVQYENDDSHSNRFVAASPTGSIIGETVVPSRCAASPQYQGQGGARITSLRKPSIEQCEKKSENEGPHPNHDRHDTVVIQGHCGDSTFVSHDAMSLLIGDADKEDNDSDSSVLMETHRLYFHGNPQGEHVLPIRQPSSHADSSTEEIDDVAIDIQLGRPKSQSPLFFSGQTRSGSARSPSFDANDIRRDPTMRQEPQPQREPTMRQDP
eukprot:PhF_6_TR41098/c0_g1_i1/m.62251